MVHRIPSPKAIANHNIALYVVGSMGFTYDPETATAEVADASMRGRIVGSPGEVMTNDEFYVPELVGAKSSKLVDLAFEIGFLIGRQQFNEGDKDG